MPLPTDTIWNGNAARVPPGYTPDRKWNCPSCDVPPGVKHEQWCPRYLYQLNPYNAAAYDSELFLADYIDTQIYFGEGHPEKTPQLPNGELILERAGITKRKRKPPENFEEWPDPGDLPF